MNSIFSQGDAAPQFKEPPMIDYIQKYGKSKRLYMYLGADEEYTGRYIGLSVLAARSECIVSRPTLGQRLAMAIRNPETSLFNSVMECMTKKRKKGHTAEVRQEMAARAADRKAPGGAVLNYGLDEWIPWYWVDVMNAIKPASEGNYPLRMQAKPITGQIIKGVIH